MGIIDKIHKMIFPTREALCRKNKHEWRILLTTKQPIRDTRVFTHQCVHCGVYKLTLYTTYTHDEDDFEGLLMKPKYHAGDTETIMREIIAPTIDPEFGVKTH